MWAVPRLCGFYLGICLTTDEKSKLKYTVTLPINLKYFFQQWKKCSSNTPKKSNHRLYKGPLTTKCFPRYTSGNPYRTEKVPMPLLLELHDSPRSGRHLALCHCTVLAVWELNWMVCSFLLARHFSVDHTYDCLRIFTIFLLVFSNISKVFEEPAA